jgi:hypothetical protein
MTLLRNLFVVLQPRNFYQLAGSPYKRCDGAKKLKLNGKSAVQTTLILPVRNPMRTRKVQCRGREKDQHFQTEVFAFCRHQIKRRHLRIYLFYNTYIEIMKGTL